MKLWKLSARELRYRPGRAALTLLSVVIGVGAVISVDVAMSTTREGYKKMFEALTGRAALEVVREGGRGFDEKLMEVLEKEPGVTAVAPLVQRPLMLRRNDKGYKLLAMGIDPERYKHVQDFELAAGKLFGRKDAVLLETSFAESLGIKLNDKIRLVTRAGFSTHTVTGLLASRGIAGFSRGGAVFLPLKQAQRLFRIPGRIDTALLVVRDGVDIKKLAADIQRKLPEGVEVREPATRTKMAEETLLTAEQGLSMAGELSLVLAMFIILNTFLMNVSERRRQFSVLRAIGATRSQVIRILLTEGALLGLVGTAIGILVGLGGAYLLTRAMTTLLQTTMPPIRLAWRPALIGAGLGIGASIISTYIPARRAGKVSPLEGMGVVSADDVSRVYPKLTLLGFVLLAIGGAVLAGSILHRVPIELAVPGGSIVLIALMLLIPLVLEPASRVIAALLFRFWPVEGQLAQRQVLRRRVRAMLTTGVLFIAISTGIGLGTTILNNTDDVYQWLDRTIVGDYFMRATMPDMATGLGADLPDEVGEKLKAMPEIAYLGTVRFVSAKIGDLPVVILAKRFDDQDRLPLDLREGDPDEVRKRLTQGEVVLGTVLAQRTGLKPGQEIELKTPEGLRRFRIAGITNEYTVGGLALYMDRATAERVLHVQGVDAYIIKAKPGMLDQLEPKLKAIANEYGLLLQSLAAVHRIVQGMLRGVVGGLWVLLALSFAVAAFGMVNTLTMNVLEQTRELALLRAVAMTRKQVRRTVVLQAALMGLIGLAPGTLIGSGMAYLMNLGTDPYLGHNVAFKLYPTLIVGSFIVAYLIVLVAAFLPARRASNVDLMTALQYT